MVTVDLKTLYLDLLQKSLMCSVYEGMDGTIWRVRGLRAKLARALLPPDVRVTRSADPDLRSEGKDWPALALTMVGAKRLEFLRECIETVLRERIPGDLIETGVWRGGACIYMLGVLHANGVTDRHLWVADSFAGLPEPDAKYPADAEDRHHRYAELAVTLEQVRANIARFGLLNDRVHFLKGWFKDTLPTAPIQKLAIARLNGDMYEGTMDALSSLYPKLSIGGYCIIDDYGALANCKQAVHDYREKHGIREEIRGIDWTGAYWRRER